MKKIILPFLIALAALPLILSGADNSSSTSVGVYQPSAPPRPPAQAVAVEVNDQPLITACANRRSDVQLQTFGKVSRLLADDNEGSRHQKFIIGVSSGRTVLVAHNIDLAPRINSLQVGDVVELYGEYEWGEKGGVMHWTHHDPGNKHPHGWIKHKGKTYQ